MTFDGYGPRFCVGGCRALSAQASGAGNGHRSYGRNHPHPIRHLHPEVPATAGLEGAFQRSRGRLEGSFEASAALRHLRMRAWVGRPSR
ncbi:hypothetical protein FVE89_12870 [Methylobacterium sp. 2A]|nr:hypothetical protein [Methylobacterium sp. 2A]